MQQIATNKFIFSLFRKKQQQVRREKKQKKKDKVVATMGSQGGCPPLPNTDFDTYVSKSVLGYSH